MGRFWPYLGDMHAALANQPALTWVVLIGCSIICGVIAGLERESKDKPAGLRTVTLICVGSTIFTLASVYGAAGYMADRTRIAAQIVTGIGFLGAGAIIRDRGRVIGLTTGATIWSVAAIGMLVGMGYAAAGLALSVTIVGMLIFAARLERLFVHPCAWERCVVLFDPQRGKARIRIRRLLDRYRVPAENWNLSTEGQHGVLDLRYCTAHPQHHAFLSRLVSLKEVIEVRELAPPAPGKQ